MSWIDEIPEGELRRLVEGSACMQLATGLDGQIYWASDAFCEFIGYSLSQLKSIGWYTISVQDAALEADKELCRDMAAGKIRHSRIQKRYIPQNSQPQWVLLDIDRVPQNGECRYAWVHVTPIRQESQQAFELSVSHAEKVEKRLADMAETIKALSSQSDEERALSDLVKMIAKYPRAFLCGVALLAGSSAVEAVIDIARTLNLLPPEQTEIVVPKGAALPQIHNGDRLVGHGVDLATKPVAYRELHLASGTLIWETHNGSNSSRPMFRTTERPGSSDSGIRGGTAVGGSASGGTHSMRGSTLRWQSGETERRAGETDGVTVDWQSWKNY